MPACSTSGERRPVVAIAAGGIEAARLAGRKGGALIVTEARPELVEAYAAAGGSGPRYAEVALCYAEQEVGARKTAHRFFRWSVAGWPVMSELPDTEGFAAASKHVSPEAVSQSVSCGPSPERHLEAILTVCPRRLRPHHPGPGRTATK